MPDAAPAPPASPRRLSTRVRVAVALLLFLALGAIGVVLAWPARAYEPPRSVTVEVRHVQNREFHEEIVLAPGEEKMIWDTPYSVRFAGFVPDFRMDPQTGEVTSRSGRRVNPASLLELYAGADKLYQQWIVHEDPEIHQVRAPGFFFQVVGMQ